MEKHEGYTTFSSDTGCIPRFVAGHACSVHHVRTKPWNALILRRRVGPIGSEYRVSGRGETGMNVELRRARALRALVLVAVLSILLMSSMLTGSVGGDAGAAEDSGTDAARIGDTDYGTLQEAVSAAADGATVVLLRDVSEDITVSGSVTLDLNGHRLTNVAGDTITVPIGASLTVTDSIQGAGGRVGAVDNITNGTACIFNNGTVVLERGTFTRSEETGNADGSNGNSYYNIVNHGTMAIGDGASVVQDGTYSSLVENGYYSYSGSDARNSHVEGTNAANPTLTITGGTFTGGLNTIKNDDGAVVTIDGGSFTTSAQYALFNVNIATVNGGAFTSPGYPLYNRQIGEQDEGLLTINGGTFSHGARYADVYDGSKTADGKVTISEGVHATVYSVGKAIVDADTRLNTSIYGDLEGVLAFCTDGSAVYTLTLFRDVSGVFSTEAVVTIVGNGHSLALTGDSTAGGIAISGDLALDGKGCSLTTSAERGIYISDASASSTISVKDLVLVNGRTEKNSDGVTTSYGIIDWMAGAGGGAQAVGNGYSLSLNKVLVRNYDSKGVYIGAAVSLDIEGCAFENTAKTWYIPSKYRTEGTVDSTDDIRNGGWDVTGGDFALQVRNFAVGAEITVKDCTFSGENGRLSSIMVAQYTTQVAKLSVSGCTFDRSNSTSLGDISIGKALNKDGTNAGNIANQAIAEAELTAGKGGMTVVYRGDDRIDDPETSDAKAFLAGMEANALAGFDATPLRLYLAEGASVSAVGVKDGAASTVAISVTGSAEAEGAIRSGESLKGELSLESIVVKEGASIDSTVSSGTSGAIAFSAVGGSGGMTISYGSDGFSWSGSFTGMDSLSVTGTVVLSMASVSADIELAAAGSSVIFQNDAVFEGTITYGTSSATFAGVTMGDDTSVSAGSVGLSGTFRSASDGSVSISGEGTVSGTVQGASLALASGASVSVPEGRSLVVRDAVVTVPEDATLTVDGTLVTVDDSHVDNAGTINVEGTFRATAVNTGKVTASVHADISRSTITGSGTVEQIRPTVSIGQSAYTATVGSNVEIPVALTDGAGLLLIVTDSDGMVVDAGWISYSGGSISAAPTAAGTYTVTATPYIGENIGQAASFTLTSVDPAPEPEPDDGDDDNTALYIGIAVLVIVVIAIAVAMHQRHR